jgi:hypothetical protein
MPGRINFPHVFSVAGYLRLTSLSAANARPRRKLFDRLAGIHEDSAGETLGLVFLSTGSHARLAEASPHVD